ncbi:MAG TPA: CBS domain-containing protein [Acidimicrobiales bacterium]|nr:CBS domain-containing protein [Acidimicrobiales bacterium]
MANTQKLREVMTPNPVTLPIKAGLVEAAQLMKTEDIGDVVVLDGDRACGIVTDRDLVVRGLAEGVDVGNLSLNDICTKDLISLTPDDSVVDAVQLMRDKAIRRLVILEGSKPVGVVSIGDLAIEGNGESALADISAAEPNN